MRRVKRMLCVILAVMFGCSRTALASEPKQQGYVNADTNPDIKIIIGEGMATPKVEAGQELRLGSVKTTRMQVLLLLIFNWSL